MERECKERGCEYFKGKKHELCKHTTYLECIRRGTQFLKVIGMIL